MDDADKYLKELKEIRRRARFKNVRGFYRSAKERPNYKESVTQANKFLREDRYSNASNGVERASSSAYQLMNCPNVDALLLGASVYEKIGKGRKVIPRLIKGVEKVLKQESISLKDIKNVEDFIKRNAKKPKSGLESKVPVFILFVIGGLVLSLTSLTATGSAISNLTGTSQGLLGLIFFIVGLVGLFFSSKP
jgi:hypothetical protein